MSDLNLVLVGFVAAVFGVVFCVWSIGLSGGARFPRPAAAHKAPPPMPVTQPSRTEHPVAIPANISAIFVSCPMHLTSEQRTMIKKHIRDGLERTDILVLLLEAGLTLHAYQESADEPAAVPAPPPPPATRYVHYP